MGQEIAKLSSACPRSEIAAYVDGELTPPAELDLETHLATCQICAEELNQQKRFLYALDCVLVEREVSLPADFTRIVVNNAGSRVSGLRRPRERFNALFICSALFLVVILGLGSETQNTLSTFSRVFEQFWAIGGFVAHLAYDIAVGAIVIVRSLCFQFVYDSAFVFAFLAILFGISVLGCSRLLLRDNRI